MELLSLGQGALLGVFSLQDNLSLSFFFFLFLFICNFNLINPLELCGVCCRHKQARCHFAEYQAVHIGGDCPKEA